jgi:dUTPase
MEKRIVSAIQPDFVPKQAHDTDAGFDVFSRVRIEIQPHTIENIPV